MSGMANIQLKVFSPNEFETFSCAADVMIPQTGRVLSPQQIAQRADSFLARVDKRYADEILRALDVLEWLIPVTILKLEPFTKLSARSRREVIQQLIDSPGLFKDVARALKLMTMFNYYTDEGVRKSIGYVEFEDRKRAQGVDQTQHTYPPPAA